MSIAQLPVHTSGPGSWLFCNASQPGPFALDEQDCLNPRDGLHLQSLFTLGHLTPTFRAPVLPPDSKPAPTLKMLTPAPPKRAHLPPHQARDHSLYQLVKPTPEEMRGHHNLALTRRRTEHFKELKLDRGEDRKAKMVEKMSLGRRGGKLGLKGRDEAAGKSAEFTFQGVQKLMGNSGKPGRSNLFGQS